MGNESQDLATESGNDARSGASALDAYCDNCTLGRRWVSGNGYRNAVKLCPLHAAAPAIYINARAALPLLKQYVDEVGGCDHSVGICCCEVIQVCEQLTELFAMVEEKQK